MVGKTLLSKGDLRMSKITMTTPLVEMDGDEMTRILWQMIKDELLIPVSYTHLTLPTIA